MAEGMCEGVGAELGAYLEGETSAAVCAEIERHLAECPDCRVVVDTLRKTVTLYRALPPAVLPEPLRQRLYAALDLRDDYRPADRIAP